MENSPNDLKSHISTKITSTFFNNEEPFFVNKEVSTDIIIDSIRQSIINQYKYQFGTKPHPYLLEQLINGFVWFNVNKNRYMFDSKESLLKYLNDNTISLEEHMYFLNIILYNQRPAFLTSDEHEQFRAGCYEDSLQ